MTTYGSVAGTVDPQLISAAECSSDVNTEAGNVVYIYAGADVIPDDIDDIDADPLVTATVRYDSATDSYAYMAAFLSPGDYIAAFTCQGRDDAVPDEDAAELVVDNEIVFTTGVNVTVVDGETVTASFN